MEAELLPARSNGSQSMDGMDFVDLMDLREAGRSPESIAEFPVH